MRVFRIVLISLSWTATLSFAPRQCPPIDSGRPASASESESVSEKDSKTSSTETDYARIFGEASSTAPAAAASSVLVQDPWQFERLRSRESPHRELASWYLQSWRDSDNGDEGITRWGVTYRTYADEYALPFSRLLRLDPTHDPIRVFDSAVGSGWLIRGLIEAREQQQQQQRSHNSTTAAAPNNNVEWYGNDILPDALAIARRDIPAGTFTFVLGDSANLTWIPPETFDAAVCGYIEPSPDALVASGYNPTAIKAWFGNWVAHMTRIVKPGAPICVGAIQIELRAHDGSECLTPDWWTDTAESNVYGWNVDHRTVQIEYLDSQILQKEWGERYCVRLTKLRSVL